jgi:hypothetical protein
MNAKPVLKKEVVQEIFRRLYLRYGADWSRHWAGLPESDMAQEWAQGLGDLAPHEVAHALEHLPDYPPNLPTFRRIALEAPRSDRFASLPAPERKTFAQLARIAAYKARLAELRGDDAKEDAYRVECAQLVEKARDAGEECRSAGGLQQLVLDETAEARRERIARDIRLKRITPETLREVPGLRFDIRAIKARIGTKAEKKYDWARMILASAERGGNVNSYEYRKAQQALEHSDEQSDIVLNPRGSSHVPRVHFPMNETRAEALARRAREHLSEADARWVQMQTGGAW